MIAAQHLAVQNHAADHALHHAASQFVAHQLNAVQNQYAAHQHLAAHKITRMQLVVAI